MVPFTTKWGTLHTRDGQRPSYAQLYIYVNSAALAFSQLLYPNLDHILMGELQDMLSPIILLPLYKQAYQVMRDSPAESETQPPNDHSLGGKCARSLSIQNLPTVDEVLPLFLALEKRMWIFTEI